ncbi:MAG: SdrD B-like domain-containing protein, partial [Sarcina sp.]
DTLELIDILPYIGDADILNNNISRNSEFKIYIISQIKFKFSTSFSEEIKNFKIEYSKSTDPTHFNSEGKEIGKVNDWSTNLPTPITDIRSFKITIKEKIFPQQKLILSLNCVIPLAIPLDKVAWNSYVLKVNYINPYDNTTIKNLLPVETQKAGVKVKSIAINKLSIGNFVWHDLNGNGIRESGEPGVNGVEVNLYNHCNNTSIATTITNNDFTEKSGYYLFDNLDSDNYCVGFILPNDYVITKQILNNPLGSKVNPLTKRTEIINLASSNFSINMGIYKYVIIEGFIWDDLNVDGIIDSNELGINNITVNLYDSKNLLKIIKSTVTNSMGKYSFNDIAPSKYKIKFIKPVGYEFTLKDIGTDKTKNSKVNEITGFTDEIELNSNEKSINENAGMIKLAKIEGMVWLDKNEDGVKDNIESGIKNIKVTLYNCDDNSETSYTTTTNRAGKYNIKNIFPGKYYALFSNTNGYKFVTTKNLVNMDGKSQCFTLLSGSVKSNLHAPLIDIKNIIVNKEVNLSKAQIGDELV